MDPLGFEAGDYNLYRYALNNPTTLTDPTGEFAFIPWLLKAGAEAAADALMQVLINYYFNPDVSTWEEAIAAINPWQTLAEFGKALIPGGGMLADIIGAGIETTGYIFLALEECREPSLEEILGVFAFNLGAEILGRYAGEFLERVGERAIAKMRQGLQKLGFDDLMDDILRKLDDVNPCSFSEDTLVSTEDGLMSIDQLDVGDYVLAYDEETGEIAFYPVTAVMVHEDPVIVLLTIDGETIETTPEHPFYTTEGEWVPAGALLTGDEVLTAGGLFGIVQAVELARRPQLMYNLTVADAHTFFVGDGQWLVQVVAGR